MNLNNAVFVSSVVRPADFMRDGLPQIVFAGKSNVGKSSVINRVLNRRNFARVGGVPGKTVHINYFRIDDRAYFVDLPGYGFAKVSKQERDRWGKLIESYFAMPERISLGVHIVDARHAPTADDKTMHNWFKQTGRPYVIVANKSDKLSAPKLKASLEVIASAFELEDPSILIPFSAQSGHNRDALLAVIEKHASV